MIAILTGDIINSRTSPTPARWLLTLKEALEKGQNTIFEIFRGDSFQLQIEPSEALLKAFYLKACLKTHKNMDVRIAVGIGSKSFEGKTLSESNGQAFILSGEKFEALKKDKVTLAFHTPWAEFDSEINVILRLALITVDNWSQITAEMVKLSLENPQLSQLELAELSKKSQSSVSEALKRAHFSDILELDTLYRKKLSKYL